MKKFTRMICVCMIMMLSFANVYAESDISQTVKPMAEEHLMVKTDISISGDIAKVTGIISGEVGKTDSVSVHLYLQRNRSGRWVNVDDWKASSQGVYCSLVKTKTITKGNTYRTKVVCTAYEGKDKEVVTKYSKVVK